MNKNYRFHFCKLTKQITNSSLVVLEMYKGEILIRKINRLPHTLNECTIQLILLFNV